MRGRPNKGNVFVGNLPPDFPDERLAEAFDPFGIVLSAAVARDPSTGARLRYGFVDIATERAMTQAITALDGSEIDGCKLNVKPRERAKKSPAGKSFAGKSSAIGPRRPGVRAAPPRRIAEHPVEPVPHHPQSQMTPGQMILSPAPHTPLGPGPVSQSQLAREGTPD